MAAAKKIAGPMPVVLDHREAYRGGRTEAFRIGDVGKVDVHDVCSSYPASMADAPDRDFLLRVRMDVPRKTKIPPVHDAHRLDTLLFPTGTVETWGYESSLATMGLPMRVLERHPVDLSWVHALAPSVKAWYERRRTTDPAESYALKITLNSLYGRLALRPEREIVRYETAEPSGECTWYKLSDGRFLVFRHVEAKNHKANYPLAAYVTDKARFRLWRGMREVEDAGGTVYYCDTDSIMGSPGTAPRDLGDGLGQWKREIRKEKSKSACCGDRLTITSVKDYEIEAPNGARFEKRKGGKGSTIWTLRRALSGKGPHAVEKRRLTPYGKRMINDDGTTEAWNTGEY
jgi:hypothetical protein